jgi:hypothetical protein
MNLQSTTGVTLYLMCYANRKDQVKYVVKAIKHDRKS